MALVPYDSGVPTPQNPAVRSMILVECGAVCIHAALLGMAEGHCRIIARADTPNTATPPISDLSVGIRNAIQHLEAIAGRRLLTQGVLLSPETATGDGADGMVIISSVGGPLRVQTLGPGLDRWGSALRRAFASLSCEPQLTPDLHPEMYPLLQAIQTSAKPHIVLLLGPGPEAIASPEARAALTAATSAAVALVSTGTGLLNKPHGPALVFLGTPEEHSLIRTTLAGRDVTVIEPPPPNQAGKLSSTLAHFYEQTVIASQPGYRNARNWASTGPISATTGLGRVVRFLSQRYSMNVLALNVGATSTLAVGASSQGNLYTTQAHMLGVRQGAGAIARRAGLAAIGRWMTLPPMEVRLAEAILQRMLHPYMLPISATDLAIDHALTREALRLIIEQGATPGGIGDLPRIDVIFGTGGVLANTPKLGQAALILLDAVQPRGITSLVIDDAQVATVLGGASLLDRMAAADAVDMDAVQIQLGTCVSTVGLPPSGEPAVRVILEYADGHRHTAEILPGTIELLPLGVGQRARLLLYPSSGVDIGMGPGERAQAGEPIEGGRLGVIIDARGRPLALPSDPGQRQARLTQWHTALGLT